MQRVFGALAVVLALIVPSSSTAAASAAQQRILVFTKTAGFRHDSIPVAIAAIEKLGGQSGFAVEATEDGGAFTDSNLARYGAVAFVLTSGDVLDDTQQAAFQRYLRAGHGWVGVHSAADTEYDWPWYGGLVGAYFLSHPVIQPAVLDVTDPRSVSTAALPSKWTRTDEWYNFRANPRASVHVLATIEEASYDGGEMGVDHPIAWWHDYDGGRAWYTAGGHTQESWSEPLFLAHVLGGIRYALGPPASAAPTVAASISSLAAAVHDRRATVTVRFSGCARCTGVLRVGGKTAPLTLVGGVAKGRSPRLPLGHARVVVVLGDGTNRVTASRPITVR